MMTLNRVALLNDMNNRGRKIHTARIKRSVLQGIFLLYSSVAASSAWALPNLTLTKEATSDGANVTSVAPGAAFAYTLKANNIGSSPATGTVTVTDPLPPGVGFVSVTSVFTSGWTCGQNNGTVTCTRSGISANASAPLITVNVTAPMSNGSVTNTATVACSTCVESTTSDNSGSATVTVAPFDLAVALRDSLDPVSIHGSFDYQLTVSNSTASPVPTSQAVTVSLKPPISVQFVETPSGNGWTCNVNQIFNMATCTHQGYDGNFSEVLTFKMRAPSTAGTLSAQATISPGGASSANDSQSEQTTVSPTDLALSKSSDLSTVGIGAPYRYSLHVTNGSAVSDSSNASVVDSLPAGIVLLHAWGAGWQCDEASPQLTCVQDDDAQVPPENGTSSPIKIDVLAKATAGTVVNNATVSSAADSTPGNNGATNSVVVTSVPSATDLQLTNTATGQASMFSGAPYSYILSVKNAGPVGESNPVTVKAIVPVGGPNPMTVVDVVEGSGWACSWNGIDFGVFEMLVTCTRPSLAANVTAPDITIKVLAGAPGTDKVRAWVTGTADTNPQNNVAQATKTVVASNGPDLNITNVSNPAYPTPVARGAAYTYTLRVGNLGPGTAGGPVIVTDVLPDGVAFVSATGTNWSCTQSNGTVTCTYLAQIGAGASTFDITINATAPQSPGLLSNQASVSSPAGDPRTTNNSQGALTAVQNTQPVALDDDYTTNPGQVLNVATAQGVLANDHDDDHDALIAVLGVDVSHGQLVLNNDGSFTYSPDSGFVGVDTFTYQASDGTFNFNVATVTITVGNSPPTIVDQEFSLAENRPTGTVVGQVLATDTPGSTLTFTITDGDPDAVFAMSPSGLITLASPLDYEMHSSYELTVQVSDGTSTSAATITITISDVVGGPGNENPPVANSQNVVAQRNVPRAITLTATDPDPGATLSYSIVNQPDHGGQLAGTPPDVTYTPFQDFVGTETFTFKANDGAFDSNIATVTITVEAANTPPQISDQTLPQVAEDASIGHQVGTVAANDDGLPQPPGTLAYSIIGGDPIHQFAIDASGTVTVALALDFEVRPTYALVVQVFDGELTSSASVTINVTDVINGPGEENTLPIAADDSYAAIRDVPLSIGIPGVLGNDVDSDGDLLATHLVTDALNGNLVLNGDGSFSYVPNPGYSGEDSFTYQVDDGLALSNVATVSISVMPMGGGEAPIASPDEYAVTKQIVVTAPGVLGNDTDLEGDTLLGTLVTGSGPAHGVLFFSSDGSFTYIADDGYLGPDSFSYFATDGASDSAPTTVFIDVVPLGGGNPPVAVDDSYPAISGLQLIVAPVGVLTNDTDSEGNTLSANLATATSHGVLMFGTDGGLRYTPDAGFVGDDSFTYRAADDVSTSNAATVHIVVHPQGGGAPPVSNDDEYTVATDDILTTDATIGVLANDVDPEGDTLLASLKNAPDHGHLAFSSDGSFRYTPDAGFAGSDTFQYSATDGLSISTASVTIHVGAGTGNQAPTAGDDAIDAVPNGTATTLANGQASVLANDTDPDLDPLTATKLIDPSAGTLLLNSDGTFSYTNTNPTATTDSFTYEACDDQLACDTATVTITIGPPAANVAPVVVDDAIQVAEGGTATTLVGGANTLLANDSDPDLDGLHALLLTPAGSGTVTVNLDGTFSYVNTELPSPAGDSFEYQACDDFDVCTTGLVTITITNGSTNRLPVVVDDAVQIQPSRTATVLIGGATSVLANDSDPDGDPLIATKLTNPSAGVATVNADGTFSYTNTNPATITDSFSYEACDNHGACVAGTVTVTIATGPLNQLPIAVDDALHVVPNGTAITLIGGDTSVLANDQDPNNDPLTAEKLTDPTAGNATLNTDGTFSYTNTDPLATTDSFVYEACDNHGACDAATVMITVDNSGGNQAPTANPQTVATAKDTPLPITLTATDPENNSLTYTIVASPNHGGQLTGIAPNMVYTPASGFNGVETFTFKANDGQLDSNIATVTVTVGNGGSGNQPPVADPQALATAQGTPLPITLTATDPENHSLTYAIVASPNHGGQLAGTPPNVTYTPAVGFNGIEMFTFKANDSVLDSNVATITITVGNGGVGNQAPIADPQTLATPQNTSMPITLTATDPDNDPLTYSIVTAPTHGGQLTGTPPNVTYAPAAGFNGTETFTFKASDSLLDSNVAIVTITVGNGGAGNQAPTASPQTLATAQDVSLPITLSATDPDGDPLTYAIGVNPDHGGQLTGTPPNVVYKPAAGFNGVEMFTFKANDGALDSDAATVTITVGNGGVGNQAPIANPQTLATEQDTPLPIALTATDPENNPLTYAIVANPDQGGQLTGVPPNMTYTPANGFNGIETFTFKANDSQLDSNVATVTITIGNGGSGNQAPVADSQTFATPQNTPLSIALTATDPENDPLTYSIVAVPASGGQLTGSPPNVTYTPATGFNGVDTFTFKAKDGTLDSNVATVTITVGNGGAGSQAPIADDQSLATARDVPLTITLTATDPDSDPLTYTVVASPDNGGHLTGTPPNVTYTPSPGFDGIETFAFRANDGILDSNVATVTITVGNGGTGNQAPVAISQSLATPQDADLAIVLTATDPDNDSLTFTVVSGPDQGGELSGIPPNMTYTPPTGFNGIETFTFKANDGTTDSNVAQVTIIVGNSAPVVVDDAIQVTPSGSSTVLVGGAFSVLENDSDPDHDALTATVATEPTAGTLTFNADGTFRYDNTDASATEDSFEYKACDPDNLCANGIVTISITETPTNTLPIALIDAIQVAPGSMANVLVSGANSVLANDIDLDGDPLHAILIVDALHGNLTLNSNGTFTYVNDESDPIPLDTFTYEACDTHGACSAAVVTITISQLLPTVNCILPRQVHDVGDSVLLDFSMMFTPPQGQTLTYSGQSLPPSLSVNAATGVVTGVLSSNDVAGSPYASNLRATTVPGGATASENVNFVVLATGETLLRNGFDGTTSAQACH